MSPPAELSVGRVGDLLRADRSAEAADLAERIAVTTADPAERATALVMRLSVLVNQGRRDEYRDAVDAAFEALRDARDPGLTGRAHAMAAIAADASGSLDRCVTHLVRAARALGRVHPPTADTARGWNNLAMAYSHVGFHGHAIAAIERAQELAAATGAAEDEFGTPVVRLRLAIELDHRGDTEGCVRVLRDLMAAAGDAARTARGRPARLAALGYAVARLAALGEGVDVDPEPLLCDPGDNALGHDLRMLSAVCLAIAAGRPIEALARLGTPAGRADTLGAPEVARLRALAYLTAGDARAAYTADREAFRLASARHERLRDQFVDGLAAWLDHADMQRDVERYHGEALTDALTGLPNRRHLEHYVNEMVHLGRPAVLGVVDLDGFKAVNTVHGHLSGDVVLQHIADILARVVRRGDFVARYGGDEFVVVLPETALPEAYEIARRVGAAVRTEDWESVVPGTPVSVTIGWAEVGGGDAVGKAFASADMAMLRAKTHARAS